MPPGNDPTETLIEFFYIFVGGSKADVLRLGIHAQFLEVYGEDNQMSDWDHLYGNIETISGQRGPHDGDSTYTINLSSDPTRIARMLLDSERNNWRVADLHDLALFVEDFVLCDHIGVSDPLLHMLGPHLVNQFPSADAFPLFSYSEHLNTYLLPREWRDLIDRYHESSEKHANGIIGAFCWIDDDTFKTIEQYFQIERAIGFSPTILLRAEYSDTSAFQFACKHYAEYCSRNGLCVSPGYVMRDAFLAHETATSISRKLYEEVASLHLEQMDRLDKWMESRAYDVPPVLSILLHQASKRVDLVPELCILRHTYAPLRQHIRDAKRALGPGSSLKDRLDTVKRFEGLRDAILRKAFSNPTKRYWRRTWSILKKGSILGALAELADIAIEWDDDRRLLGGLSRFIDLERMALGVFDDQANVARHFGDICPI